MTGICVKVPIVHCYTGGWSVWFLTIEFDSPSCRKTSWCYVHGETFVILCSVVYIYSHKHATAAELQGRGRRRRAIRYAGGNDEDCKHKDTELNKNIYYLVYVSLKGSCTAHGPLHTTDFSAVKRLGSVLP